MIELKKQRARPADKFGAAGFNAEKQMAYYLKRAFGELDDVFVYNDLCLDRNGDSAQIDHLVLHRFGFVIVESKSVHETIRVNEHGEFSRRYGEKWTGMQSPIQQARLQRDLLAKLLNDNAESLRDKVWFGLRQAKFGEDRFKVLIAVSDHGIIDRSGIEPPELCKADRIVDEIRQIIARNQKGVGIALKELLAPLTDEEMHSIRDFLLDRDSPKAATARKPTSQTTQSPTDFKCKDCKSGDLTILKGRYGLYFKCHACDGNTRLKIACPECGEMTQIFQSGQRFKWSCKPCGASDVFFTNRE